MYLEIEELNREIRQEKVTKNGIAYCANCGLYRVVKSSEYCYGCNQNTDSFTERFNRLPMSVKSAIYLSAVFALAVIGYAAKLFGY